jgi:hypothetical protein
MAKGNILKEAIADAKAVREVALANAKAALEEAFTPKLNRMLSAKLSEDLDEEMYDEDENLELGEMMYDEDDKDMEEMMYDEDEDMDEGHIDGHGMEEDSMDEEIDLEEILNELELEEGDAEEEVVDEEANNDDNLEEEFDLNALLEEINKLDEQASKPVQGQRSVPQTSRRNFHAKPKSKRKTMAKRNQNMPNPGRVHKSAPMNAKMSPMMNEACVAELEEMKKAFSSVKSELNEVNLLNSKLLYVNRIFKANQLDEGQKLRVVETLDKAGTTKEAKLIYETIKDSFSISNETLEKKIKKEVRNTAKRSPKKSIRENLGMASKAAGMSRTKKVAPKRAVISESDSMVNRFQKLANIKINE